MNTRPGILIVDRDAVAAQALEQVLSAQGYPVHIAPAVAQSLAILQKERVNPQAQAVGVVLADQDAAGGKGAIDLVRELQQAYPSIVPIMISAFRKVESAVTAMRLGAADYLLKPIVESELLDAVQRAEQRHLLLLEHETKQVEVSQPKDGSVGEIDHANVTDDWKPMPLSEAMKEPERRILLAALEANDWNRGETAKQLDINRTTLYKKIRQHRLDEPA